VTKFC